MEKIKITKLCQFEKLVEELEKNPSLARGFRRGTTPSNFKEQWESVATVLNSLGPPTRTGEGWQKIPLSPLEEAVANLLQFEKQINPEGMVQGATSTEDSISLNLLESLEEGSIATTNSNDVPPSTSIPSSSVTPPTSEPSMQRTSTPAITTSTNKKQIPLKKTSSSKKIELPDKRNDLLKKHSVDQERILTEISNSMMSMKRTLRELKEIEAKRLKLEIEKCKKRRRNALDGHAN